MKELIKIELIGGILDGAVVEVDRYATQYSFEHHYITHENGPTVEVVVYDSAPYSTKRGNRAFVLRRQDARAKA